MRPRTILASVILMLACGLMLPAWASAEVVGHITQVEGRVDLLKGGKLPATPVALQDKVEPGDVLRTKSLSKAQITFVDNSIITLSPESRLAVDEYQFDPGQQKRNAVLNLFQGMAHVLVNKLYKVDEPDFVIKTFTAVTGVRGTDFGVRLQPNASTILNFQGVTQVANIFPEVSKLDRRAFKAAFAFGSPGSSNSVLLRDMQGTTVGRGLPPTLPFTISAEDRKQFMNQMSSGLMSRKSGQGSGSGSVSGSGSGPGSSGSSSGTGTAMTGGGTEFMTNPGGPDSGLITPAASSGTTSPSVPLVAPTGLTTGTGNATLTTLNTVTVPPVATSTQTASLPPVVLPPVTPPPPVEPPVTPPTPATYAFTQTGQATWTSTAASPFTTTTVTSNGWGLRTGITTADPSVQALPASYAGYYTSSGAGDRSVAPGNGSLYSAISTGVTTSTLTGTVTGVAGGTLTGTGTMTGTSSFGQTTSDTGTVTIDPSGVLTFTYGGANGTATNTSQARLATATGTTIYTPGTSFTQSLSGAMSHTSLTPYTTQSTATTWGAATTTSGTLAPYYAVSLTGTDTPNSAYPWHYNYLPWNYDSLAGTIRGVVSGLQGAATITPPPDPLDTSTSFVSALPTPPSPYLFGRGSANTDTPVVTTVTIDPTTGGLSGTVHTTNYDSGQYASGVYTLTQTPQTTAVTPPASATYGFTQTYNGWLGIGNNMGGASGNTLQSQSNGWGQTTGVAASGISALPAPYATTIASPLTGYFSAWDQGTWNVTSGTWPNAPYGYNSTVAVSQLSGQVTGVLGQTLSGPMKFYGSLLNGASFQYNGTVTIDSYGDVQFTYTPAGNSNGQSLWTMTTPSGFASGTASGTMYQNQGYYFTQTMGTPGNYVLTTSSYNGTLSLSGTGGSRSYVYGGSLGPFSGLFYVNSPDGSTTLPSSSSGTLTSPLTLQGVAGYSDLGSVGGNATLTVNTGVLNFAVPGQISLTNGGTYFNGGSTVQSNVGPIGVYMNTGSNTLPTTPLTTGSLYSFSETYQGFRIATGSAPFTLSNVEGYGWGTIGGTSLTGTAPLPTSYTSGSTTGYFVSQDLGTRASLYAVTPGWAGVTGSMTGTLSGTAGQTLTGQMAFTGTNSHGAVLNYQGNATLASNGTLVWNYYGNWYVGSSTAPTNIGTASGTWTQVLGTYFTETVQTGTFVQATTSTTIGGTAYSSGTVKDVASVGGTRTIGTGSPTTVTASYAGIRTSTVNPITSGGGTTPNFTVQGVVAGSPWQTQWGVATISGTAGVYGALGSKGISGPVTLDPTGQLTGQFVDMIPNGSGQAADNAVVNYVSVPTGSGQTTSSFVQTVSGAVTQTPVGSTPSTQATLTTPTPLAGTGTGTIPGNINANVALSSTAASATYVTPGPTPMSAQIIGAVGGPAGGTQTGVASMHSLKGTGANTRALQHLGTATFQPAAGSIPATLTTTLNGLNPTRSGGFASQTGTVTVTPKP